MPWLLPEHTVVLPLTEPPTEAWLTVIVARFEFAVAQVPLMTTARYLVVWVRLLYAWVVDVLLMVDQVLPPLVEDSHLITAPD